MRSSRGFPLDPVSLPFPSAERNFRADLLFPPLGIFSDALPDDWGKSLLAAALKLQGRKPTPAEMLLLMRGGGTGALLFTESSQAQEPDRSSRSADLQELLSAAERFEAGTLPSGAEFRKLLDGSSRAGGARPKALVHVEAEEWLAKFPSVARDHAHDVVGLEASCLKLARRAGLKVPDSRLENIGRRRVLMVRRFDVTPHAGRIHMISLSTLCRERPGIYANGYSDLAEVVRRISTSPTEDVSALFNQMTFNAAIGNVDDHLKNFWMLGSPAGYRLAPAFDLVPDVTGRGDHTLAFASDFGCPNRRQLLALGDTWKVAQASTIVDTVIEVIRTFEATFAELKVQAGPALDIVRADIHRRLKIMSTMS